MSENILKSIRREMIELKQMTREARRVNREIKEGDDTRIKQEKIARNVKVNHVKNEKIHGRKARLALRKRKQELKKAEKQLTIMETINKKFLKTHQEYFQKYVQAWNDARHAAVNALFGF
jgi:hypothetical protein